MKLDLQKIVNEIVLLLLSQVNAMPNYYIHTRQHGVHYPG